MKILYVSQFFKPERVAAAFRAYDNARIWCEMGEDVTIFTAYPNFPTGKLFDGYKISLLDEERIDGIRVLRSKILIKENTSKLNRILNSMSFLVLGIYNVIFNRKKIGNDFDVVLGTSGTILAPIIAYVYSLIKRIPFVLELRDITYIQVLAVYDGKKNILFKLVKGLELFLCKRAARVIVVTSGFKDELIEAGIDKDKIVVIYNGIDTSSIIASKINKGEEVVFSYMGNIGASQNLINIIDIYNAIKLQKHKKKLIIIGDGAKKEEIIKYVEENSYDDIFIKDGMSLEELEEYYDISDLCIVSLNNNEFFKNTIPSKIFQIMGRGKNVLYFGPEGEATKIIAQIDKSFIFSDLDSNITIKKINKRLNSEINLKNYLYEKGIESRKYIKQQFNREVLATKLLNELKAIDKKMKPK